MSAPGSLRDPFPPGRSEPCFCGSGRRFKHCCGSMEPGRPPPNGIEIRNDFLSPEQCRDWVEFAASRPSERLKVLDREASDSTHIAKKFHEGRVTERVDLGDRVPELKELMQQIYSLIIGPHLDREFAWFETPHMLKYNTGGFYRAHADSDEYEPEHGRWAHALDRDISVLLYLNDAFEGGDLTFEYLAYRIQPRPGMLVWFPSDARYYHGAEPVTAGTRYALVSWAAFSDTAKLRDTPPESAVMLDPVLPPTASED